MARLQVTPLRDPGDMHDGQFGAVFDSQSAQLRGAAIPWLEQRFRPQDRSSEVRVRVSALRRVYRVYP